MKAEKWARLRATGALPEYLLQLYDQESKQSPMGKRAFQTQIINKLFKKVNGSWQLDASDAQFKDYKALYEKRYSKEENEAMPRSLQGFFSHSFRNGHPIDECRCPKFPLVD